MQESKQEATKIAFFVKMAATLPNVSSSQKSDDGMKEWRITKYRNLNTPAI